MVSTRLMSNGGSTGGVDPASGEPGCSRITRHSGISTCVQATSPQHQSSTLLISNLSKCNLVPPPRVFNTSLLDMPPEILAKIFRMLGYKAVAHLRMVNRQFNAICSSILNSTFQKLQTQMLNRFQAIKSKMPRRESARRNHPLACESDIIETLHMRLCLLQMTFGKHIERKHCCFFPGEILDEVYRILDYLKVTTNLPRPYKITDEIFDLSSMAMEYYKEHIEPNLPEITYFGTDYFDITGAFSPGESSKSYLCVDSPGGEGTSEGREVNDCGVGGRRDSDIMLLDESLPPTPPPPQSNMVLRKRIHRIKQGMKRYNNQLTALRTDLRSCKRKTAWQQKQIAEQQKQLAEHQKQTMDYASRLDDYDKKNEEISRKFQTLLQELNKCKTELQYWRSKSPALPALCSECGISLGHLGPFAPPLFPLAQALVPAVGPQLVMPPALLPPGEPEVAITADIGTIPLTTDAEAQSPAPLPERQSVDSSNILKKSQVEETNMMSDEAREGKDKIGGSSCSDEGITQSPSRRSGAPGGSGDEGPSNKRSRCSSDDGVCVKKRRFNRSLKPRKCL